VRALRKKLKLTQEQFVSRFHLPLGTGRDWEQGAHRPDKAAEILLRIIARDPDACALLKASFFLNFISRTDKQHSGGIRSGFRVRRHITVGDGLKCGWSFISVHRLLWLPVTVLRELWQLFLAVIPLEGLT
jgi:transcriptional regulator with XRE-family HTH domain